MKKMMFALAAVTMVLLTGAPSARAQGDVQTVKVPVPFIVNGRLLPAGTYRITKGGTYGSLLTIANENEHVAPVLVATDPLDRPPQDGLVRLQFENYHGHYFLSRVAISGEDVREVVLNTREMDQMLAKLNLTEPEPALGSSTR